MRAFPECVDVTAGVGRFSGREMWEKAICVYVCVCVCVLCVCVASIDQIPAKNL